MRVNSYAQVSDSVILDAVRIGRKAVVEKAILDKNVVLEDGAEVGVDHDKDRERGFHVSEGGVVVVPKNTVVSG
ncbi:hypothetical protein GCM10025883_15780 [Mobilicoccus caccae]|uniref:Glucose-1-phosphate adenylyltransferase/Bifunctional protein GlmU-like C-terminal hexapeptide domain-containing protein n=1 Tax=Mobilicoccus caccae TaxID=1859295 RepID=A0ABQ6INN2_9MICO|nr:hypothetical protein GCM10025883_15780 [Mobilicoccus caccae]